MNAQQALAQLAVEIARLGGERDQLRAQLEQEVPRLRAEVERLTAELGDRAAPPPAPVVPFDGA